MNPTDHLNGPIPGMALTQELGSAPNERPPKFVKPVDAYEDIVSRLSTEDAMDRIVASAKLDIPVELTARAIVYAGWAGGNYTTDVMHLIFGPVFELMMGILDDAGVEYRALANRKSDPQLEEAMDMIAKQEGTDDDAEGDEVETETEMDHSKMVEGGYHKMPDGTIMKGPSTGMMGRSE
tara:strand:- start:58 stop:597 length:540 start_codon:yes stop_codon:yes gene_type:complete